MNQYHQTIIDYGYNKYVKWYLSICKRSQLKFTTRKEAVLYYGYTEEHHILPKSLCSDDIQKNDKSNRVYLSAREHFICHWLLTKITHSQSMFRAFWGLTSQHSSNHKRYKVCSKVYELSKKAYSKSISGDNHWMKSEKSRKNASIAAKKRILNMTEEQKKNKRIALSMSIKGRILSPEHKDRIGKANKNKKRSSEMNMRQSMRQKEYVITHGWKSPTLGVVRDKQPCHICGTLVDVANMNKWHGDKCRFIHISEDILKIIFKSPLKNSPMVNNKNRLTPFGNMIRDITGYSEIDDIKKIVIIHQDYIRLVDSQLLDYQ